MGGDDISLILNSPGNLNSVIYLFTNIYQYRPLPYAFFFIYKLLPLNMPLLHSITLFFLANIAFCFYIFLQNFLKQNKILSFVIAFCYSISHILFYSAFTLSGIIDLIFLIFFWLTLICFYLYLLNKQTKILVASLFFFLLTIFSKEIFLIIPILISAYLVLFGNKIKAKFKTYLFFWMPTAFFYAIKFYFYKPIAAEYAYSLNINVFKDNIINFVLWLFNFKHGWQMGMALPVDKIYYFLVFIYCLFFLFGAIIAFKKKFKLALFLVIWVIAGLLPFFFLSRTLVYYLDVSLFPFLVFFAIGIDYVLKINQKAGILLLAVFLGLNVYFSQTILSQWLKFSFVANSVETSENFYREVYVPYDWENKYSGLCVLGLNSDTSWATAKGEEINLFTKRKIKVANDDAICQKDPEGSLIFENSGREFILRGK